MNISIQILMLVLLAAALAVISFAGASLVLV
jgi:hypothetical protein